MNDEVKNQDEQKDVQEQDAQQDEQATKQDEANEAPQEETKPEANEDTKEEQDNSDSPEEEEVEVPEQFKALIEQIENMTVLELNELVKVLEKKFGVSAVAVAAAGAAGGAGGAEEKDEFDVVLTGIGDQKIAVIKVVKEVLGLGLKEAKEFVESAPKPIKEGVKKEEAEELKAKFEEAGATVELK